MTPSTLPPETDMAEEAALKKEHAELKAAKEEMSHIALTADKKAFDPRVMLVDDGSTHCLVGLETGRVITRPSGSLYTEDGKGRPEPALRRMVLETTDGVLLRHTGEMLPCDHRVPIPEMYTDLRARFGDSYTAWQLTRMHFVRENDWCIDWPHYETESEGDNPDSRSRMLALIDELMAPYGLDFKVTGLQRRFLMYYSDGDEASQKFFEALLPIPESCPFRRSGALRSRFASSWSHEDRDKNVPKPAYLNVHDTKPCLYRGPAWVLRFTVGGVNPAFGGCRVYLDDDGQFLCSDWCQRHDFSSYGGGINLQLRGYDLPGWILGPCITRAAEHNIKVGKSHKRVAMRSAMKENPNAEKSFEQLLDEKLRVRGLYLVIEEGADNGLSEDDAWEAAKAQLVHTFDTVDAPAYKANGAIVWAHCEQIGGCYASDAKSAYHKADITSFALLPGAPDKSVFIRGRISAGADTTGTCYGVKDDHYCVRLRNKETREYDARHQHVRKWMTSAFGGAPDMKPTRYLRPDLDETERVMREHYRSYMKSVLDAQTTPAPFVPLTEKQWAKVEKMAEKKFGIVFERDNERLDLERAARRDAEKLANYARICAMVNAHRAHVPVQFDVGTMPFDPETQHADVRNRSIHLAEVAWIATKATKGACEPHGISYTAQLAVKALQSAGWPVKPEQFVGCKGCHACVHKPSKLIHPSHRCHGRSTNCAMTELGGKFRQDGGLTKGILEQYADWKEPPPEQVSLFEIPAIVVVDHTPPGLKEEDLLMKDVLYAATMPDDDPPAYIDMMDEDDDDNETTEEDL